MQQSIQVVTKPAYEPMSRSEAKDWLKIDLSDTNHDRVIDRLIRAVRRDAENRTFRALIPRTLRLNIDCWPSDYRYPSTSYYGVRIVLPWPPLIEVTSIQYVDINGDTQTLADTQYEAHAEIEPAVILPTVGSTWPNVRLQPNAVQVNYRAGYAPGSPDDEAGHQEMIPENLRIWMGMKMATLFENPEQVAVGSAQVIEFPHDYTDGLLDDLIVGSRLF